MTSLSARDKILGTAHDLFYRHGIRATGIDRIIQESAVAKVTFYRHFPGKHDLILAFLDYRHERWIRWFTDALQRHGAATGGGLDPVIPALAEWFRKPEFRGCAFINSVAELGEFNDVVTLCKRHKADMRTILANLLPGNAPDRAPGDAIASAAAIAVDGAIFKAQLEGSRKSRQNTLAGLALILQALQSA